MMSLREYLLNEDESKFVPVSYSTTQRDDVCLAEPLAKCLHPDEEPEDTAAPGGGFPVDIRLASDIHLYSEQSYIFSQRKRKIASTFRRMLKDSELTAPRIRSTRIFRYYIDHLVLYYRKNIDEDARLNLATMDELSRQVAADFVMILRDREIFPGDDRLS